MSIEKTRDGLGDLKWDAQYEAPFWERRTYTCTEASNLKLTWDEQWAVRINGTTVREFHYLGDAQNYCCKLVLWIQGRIVGDSLRDQLATALGYYGANMLGRAV